MKKIIPSLLFLAFIYSCEKDQALTPNIGFNPAVKENYSGGTGNNNGTSNQFMTANVNGLLTNLTTCDADTFGFFGSEFEISGSINPFSINVFDRQSISLEVYDPNYIIKIDTNYSMDNNGYFTGVYSSDDFNFEDSTIFYSETGQVRFSVATPSGYEGTFSFTAKNSDNKEVKITNGSFKAIIKKQ